MRAQGEPQEAVVVDHLLAQWHRGQSDVGFARHGARCRRFAAGGKQRQIVITVADAAERLGRPQRLAPRQAERAESIGIGEALQYARRQAGAQPDIPHGVVGNIAPCHDQLGVLLAQPLDLAQAEAHRVTGAQVVAHGAMQVVQASDLGFTRDRQR